MPTTEPLESRFARKYLAEPTSGCWLWEAATNNKGYGVIGFSRKRLMLAHRVSWLLYRGQLRTGLLVLHRCDTPCCVNPYHLFVGSQADNMADARSKNRHCRSGAKVTEKQVEEIRLLAHDGFTQQAIGRAYNLDQSQISNIVNRRSWTKESAAARAEVLEMLRRDR